MVTVISDAVRAAADPVVDEALDVVADDSVFISVKTHRALHGRDEFEHGEGSFDEDPVQSDWNGFDDSHLSACDGVRAAGIRRALAMIPA